MPLHVYLHCGKVNLKNEFKISFDANPDSKQRKREGFKNKKLYKSLSQNDLFFISFYRLLKAIHENLIS